MSKIMPLILAAGMSGGGGGGNQPIIITAESNTTVQGYQVPELTSDNILAIYNGVVAGKEVVIVDATEKMHFMVNQADTVSDEIFISYLYFDIMILQYNENGEITATKIPKTASDITALNSQTVQQNLERIDDELSVRQITIEIDEFPETLSAEFLYRVTVEITHSGKTYPVGLYQVVNSDLVQIADKSYVDNAIGAAIEGEY